ncbi:MAG: DNA-processing protein DprA [Candidatus Omnitrophica bacterium]|nr:DNA-processing protein DprA [Candidatus Omnitrophota bacterium]
MNKLEALVSLNMVGGIGSVRLKRLLEFFGKPEAILDASPEKLMAVSGIGEETAYKIHSFQKNALEREFILAKRDNLKILTQEDRGYPESLKNIYDPPIVLYIKGELKEEDKYSLAIVGCRRASFYGLRNAERFAFELANCGFTVISGMARGIDTASHHGALKAKGRTIAVLGSGLGNIYPPENKELSEDISANGAVISEFPIEEKPLRQNFPRRNRLISGLSLGVLVVEAGQNSGALITADFALEQGREVFSLPGEIDSRGAFGTNRLIKEGAKPVLSVDDILEELIIPGRQAHCKVAAPVISATNMGLEKEEAIVYNLIQRQPVGLDELIETAGIGLSDIMGTLLKLQMKRLIRELPGKQFARMNNEG